MRPAQSLGAWGGPLGQPVPDQLLLAPHGPFGDRRVTIFLRHAHVVTRLLGGRVIDDAGVLIRDGRIELCGPLSETESQVGPDDDPVIDVSGCVVIPAPTNAHTHLYSSLARGMPPPRQSPTCFTEILERVWWPLDAALDEEDVYLSALVGLMDCARSGVATVIDHHASQTWIDGSLDAVRRAADDLGLRLATCFEVSDRGGSAAARAGIEENMRFARKLSEDKDSSGRMAAFMGLHASLTLSDETLDEAVGQASDLGLGCHVHVAEDAADNLDATRRGADSALRRLAARNVLGCKGIAAHCVYVDEDEMALLSNTRTRVVINPESNQNNAVGRPRIGRLRQAGVRLAVGTDGLGSDVLRSAFSACLLEGFGEKNPAAGFSEAATLLEGNAELTEEVFGLHGAGSLEPGAPADLAVLDYDPPTPLNTENALGHLLFGNLGSRVKDTMVDGRWVMRDRGFPDLDEEEINARARERAQKLWSRMG